MLTSFFAKRAEPIARVVHIGAGTGTDLPAYLAAGATSVLLVEARAETAAELTLKTAADSRIETLQGVVSADVSPRPFLQTNFPELDSLSPPTEALRELFPGLRILSEKTVTPLHPVALLQDRPIDADGPQILVLETPGETLGLLKALADADLLQHFEAIFLKDWLQPLYLNAAPAEQIFAYLGEQEFQVTPEARPQDPECPWVAAHQNRTALARRQKTAALLDDLKSTQAQITALTKERDQARQALAQQKGDLETARAQITALTEEYDQTRQALAQQKGDLDTAQAQTAALVSDLAAAREQNTALIAEHEKSQKATEQRLQQSRDEMLKTEGQLQMLRRLFLDETSL